MAKKPIRLVSEQQVLDMLGIEDFRHMSKQNTIEFISSIPYMDKEVAMAAIAQFPEYTKMATEIANDYKEAFEKALDSNDKSVQSNYEVINTVISVLSDIAQGDDLTPEMKMQIADKLAEMPKHAERLDKNNKNFLLKALGIVGGVLGGVILGGIVVLGGNGKIDLPGGESDSDDIDDDE